MTKIVTLIGSSRFKDAFHEIGANLEKQGTLPLMMSFFQHADGVEISAEERETLRTVDRARIDLCHEVLVINCRRAFCSKCSQWLDEGPGCECTNWRCNYGHQNEYYKFLPYIGADTKYEIEYATSVGKPIEYLEKDM